MMTGRVALSSLVVLVAVLMPCSSEGTPVLGQIDTFQGGTTAGWSVGASHPTPPVNVADGGPAGAGDRYLSLQSNGRPGPGGRLSTFNMTQWAGDYLASGVGAISMDLRNFGQSDVYLRLLVAGPFGPMGPANVAVTEDVALLRAGGAWERFTFSLQPADLAVMLGAAEGALANAQELRLFHNPDPIFTGPADSSPPITAQIGVDNIEAFTERPVPEPGTLLLLAGAIGAAITRRRRR